MPPSVGKMQATRAQDDDDDDDDDEVGLGGRGVKYAYAEEQSNMLDNSSKQEDKYKFKIVQEHPQDTPAGWRI